MAGRRRSRCGLDRPRRGLLGMNQEYLKPEVVSRLVRLDLIARLVVEGFITGLHQSPYHGFSVEFSEYRQYMPGDSLRDLDWKVFGKTDRLYVKQYEEETNLKSHLLIDASASMAYGSNAITKFQYASYTAAALIPPHVAPARCRRTNRL